MKRQLPSLVLLVAGTCLLLSACDGGEKDSLERACVAYSQKDKSMPFDGKKTCACVVRELDKKYSEKQLIWFTDFFQKAALQPKMDPYTDLTSISNFLSLDNVNKICAQELGK